MHISAGNNDLVITSLRDRLFLATLLLRVGDTVPISSLADAIWGAQPPKDARSQLHGCAWRLRRQLVAAGGSRELIVTDPAGYRLAIEPVDADLYEFRQLRDRARQAAAAGSWGTASRWFRSALALWHGPALAGLASDVLQQSAVTLEEEHTQALEQCLETELSEGKAESLIPELTELIQHHPFREKLHGELMLALYRAGRQADALVAYRNVRQLLIDELGAEPGVNLQNLHRAILNRDSSLIITQNEQQPHPQSPSTDFRPSVPRTLPPDISDFVGREKEVAASLDILTRSGRRGTPVVVMTGPPGVGKTALSIRVAHELRSKYNDGQLFVDMHGFDADTPVSSFDALGRFLRSLGVDGATIPGSLDERVELYRNLLAGRAVLVVLDNSAAEEQVLPLIPGGETCGILVTSRFRLGTTLGADTINIDPLEAAAAADMVTLVAGRERTATEADAVTELAQLCGYLPLAIRIAAGKLATKPHWSVARLIGQLRDERKRLDQLTYGTLDVRASIELSYRTLDEAARRLLRRLGEVDLPEVHSWVCAALLDSSIPDADEVVEQLVDAQLIEIISETELGLRYRLHDLVRIFARERAAQDEAPESVARARTRVFGAGLFLTVAAYRILFGGDHQNIVGSAPRWAIEDHMVSTWINDPLLWFETERQNITAIIHHAADAGYDDVCWELASTATPLYQTGRHYDDWQAVLESALATAKRTDNSRGQAAIYYRLGWLYTDYMEYARAKSHLDYATLLFDKVDDAHGYAIATASLGMVQRHLGDDDSALRDFGIALPVLRDRGDRWGEAFTLRSIGQVYLKRANYTDAATCFERAKVINQAIGSLQGQAQAIFWRGMLSQHQGRYEEAEGSFREALDIARIVGDRSGQAQCLRGIGLCYEQRDLPEPALRSLAQALDLIRQPRPTQIQTMIREAIARIEKAGGGGPLPD